VLDANGNKTGAVIVMHDISEQREAGHDRLLTMRRIQQQQATILQLGSNNLTSEGRLDDAAQLIAELCANTLEVAAVSIWLYNQERTQLRCLDRYERASRTHIGDLTLAVTNYPRYQEALQTSRTIDAFDACIDPRTSEFCDAYFRPRAIGATLDASIRLGNDVVGVLCCEHIGGTRRWTADEVTFAAAIADQIAQCITAQQRRQSAEKLAYEASHDVLTGLLNRWEFERQIRTALDDAKTTQRQHALIFIDLDQFKVVNENCGHVAGDQLLRQVSELLKAELAGRGLLARFGGDEFAILLLDYPVERATLMAEQLRKSLNDLRFTWEGKLFRIGASFGIVPILADGSSTEAILRAADAACYVAKEQGRNRIQVYQSDDTGLARRRSEMQWAARIRSALDENRLRLVRHDIVPVKGPAPGLHYELLIRLIDEQGKMTGDANFFSAAERFGFAPQIDQWVVSTALDWLENNPDHLRQLHLSCINLSGLSLGQEDFLRFLQRRLREGRVPPQKICFEITETAAMTNLDRATEFMTTLKGMGCSFSMDDFGTGLSSYAYLRKLPVDFLKIDGSFVRKIADDPIDLALLRSMNEIGQMLGKKTIAEYAENERVIQKLREVGVDYMQGHGVSLPVPMDAPVDSTAISAKARPGL
jgi:diguanylate cyclase (GGDEF)-like protein